QMPRPGNSNSKNASPFDGPRHRPKWFAASMCFLLGAWLSVTLMDYKPIQSHEFQMGGRSAWNGQVWAIEKVAAPQPNLGGPWGAEIAWWCLHMVGVGTWFIPVFLLWFSWVAVRNARRFVFTRAIAMTLCIMTLAGLMAMVESFTNSDYYTLGLGGWVGKQLYGELLKNTVGVVGAGLLLGTIYALTFAFIFSRDVGAEIEKALAWIHGWRLRRAQNAAERAEREQKERVAKEKAEAARAAAASMMPPVTAKKQLIIPKTKEDLAREAAPAKTTESTPPERPVSGSKPPVDLPASASRSSIPPLGKLNIVKPEETKKAKAVPLAHAGDNYQFPPLSLLREPITVDASSSEEEHRQNAENLLRILGEFNVEVTLGEIHVGPVITRYEVVPAAGVRVEKISGLDKNIALGMRAQSV